MADFDAIFKAYDIRGIVGPEIDADACLAIGAGFGGHARDGGAVRAVVGRDMRPHGEELAGAFIRGVTGAGLDVVDIGLCATEMVYFASGLLDAPGAMFTASHNPAAYNGIKLCGAGAAPMGSDTGLAEIKARARSGPSRAAVGGSVTRRDLLDRFVEHVLSFVGRDALRPLRLVVDSANGMGGLVAPAVLGELPHEVDYLHRELDGTFPNHPADPLNPENLRDLQHRVRACSADAGLAFDGDADRVFLVDESSRPLSGSLTASLLAARFLEGEPGAAVVGNVICSRAFGEVVSEQGGRLVRSRVGHTFMKQAMASSAAVFGGEHSGHFYFRDNYSADSAMIAAVVALETLARGDAPLSGLVAPLERYAASGEINTEAPDPDAAIERVAAAFEDRGLHRLDGLTVDCGDWWFNLRPSNTEPLLRLNLEAADAAAVQARVADVLALLAA